MKNVHFHFTFPFKQTIVVKLVHLNTSYIYNHNHMVGMDKISSSAIYSQCDNVVAYNCLWNGVGDNTPFALHHEGNETLKMVHLGTCAINACPF